MNMAMSEEEIRRRAVEIATLLKEHTPEEREKILGYMKELVEWAHGRSEIVERSRRDRDPSKH
jgi:hypothetical protein